MDSYVDETVLENFKSRLCMRLSLTQSSIEATVIELEEMKAFVQSLPKDFPLKKEAKNTINAFDSKLDNGLVEIQHVIQEVEALAQITWQQMSELHDKSPDLTSQSQTK